MPEIVRSGKWLKPDIHSSLYLLENMTEGNETYGVAMTVFGDHTDCYFITSNHLLESDEIVRLTQWRFQDGGISSPSINAEKYAEFPGIDLAILKAPHTDSDIECQNRIELIESPDPRQQLYGYGNPVGSVGAVSAGIVSSYWNNDKHGQLIVSDMKTVPGYSGGAVFTEGGFYVGMLLGTTSNTKYENFAYIVPGVTIVEALKRAQLITNITSIQDSDIDGTEKQ